MNVRQRRTQACSGSPSWKLVFRSHTVGIVGPAIAAVLWGIGYKLYIYRRNARSSSRILAARSRIETQNALVAANVELGAKVSHLQGSSAFAIPIQRLLWLCRGGTCVFPVCKRNGACFNFLIPFRSPPSKSFFPAKLALRLCLRVGSNCDRLRIKLYLRFSFYGGHASCIPFGPYCPGSC